MSQPTPALALALLMVGPVAAAQPQPRVRAPQHRGVTLPSTPETPVPEVYVAPGFLTTLVFPTLLERTSVVLDEQVPHFALVEVGDRSLTLEPRVELEPEKKLGLRVRFRDGTAAALVVTSHATQVDTRVSVDRPRSMESLLAELAEKEAELAALRARVAATGPSGMVLSGVLDGQGVQVVAFSGKAPPDNRSGLTVREGMGYRTSRWAVMSVLLRNLPGQQPWTPGSARLFGAGGLEVKVRAIHLDQPPLTPGESSWVVVETGALPPAAGEVFRLELVDKAGGRLLRIEDVSL